MHEEDIRIHETTRGDGSNQSFTGVPDVIEFHVRRPWQFQELSGCDNNEDDDLDDDVGGGDGNPWIFRLLASEGLLDSEGPLLETDHLPYFESWLDFAYDHNKRKAHCILGLDGLFEFMICAEFWPAAALMQLPAELVSIVVHLILHPVPSSKKGQRKEVRATLSRTSLVCRSWWIYQRSKIFAELLLDSLEDVHFLLDMLHNPRNRQWLPAVLTEVQLALSPTLMDRSFKLLNSKLVSLTSLDICPIGHRISDSPRQKYPLPSLQPFLASLHQLRILCCSSTSFFSLSSLSHALAGMPALEELHITQLPWLDETERPPTRMSLSSFPRLRSIGWHGTAMPIWLYAPFLARHCKLPPEDVTSGNPDAKLLVLLMKHLAAIHSKSSDTDLSHFEAVLFHAHTFQLKSYVTPFELSPCVWEVQLWPSDGRVVSAIRNIKFLDGPDQPPDIEVDWNLVDSGFAEEAVNLETMTIYSDHEGWTLEACLPKLGKLGKLSRTTSAEWDGLWRAGSESDIFSHVTHPETIL